MIGIEFVDAMVYSDRYKPYWGWHDDHRSNDGTANYRPALQQVRGEFAELLQVLGYCSGCALQLGMGECSASHDVWREVFGSAVTVDWKAILVDEAQLHGGDTRDEQLPKFLENLGPFDFLLFDASHDYLGLSQEYVNLSPLVRRGGIIVFHDVVDRPQYPELAVGRFVKTLPVQYIGAEVGLAWMRKP